MGPLLPKDLRNWSCDEDYLGYLAGRRAGDPIPEGIITDVDPFSSNPWDLLEDSWYLLQQSTHGGNGESGGVTRTENGFWRLVNTTTVPTVSFIGWKNVFEFYQGDTPVGTRTGWVMHQYYVQVDSSLCRIFWHSGERLSSSSQQNNSLTSCADFHILGSDMLKRNEEREAPPEVNFSHDGFIEMKDLMSSDGEISKQYGDYLELNDILSSDTASTSTGNSSRTSIDSDKCIDLDELLREIMRDEGPVPMEDQEKVDCISGFTGSVQSDRTADDFLELRDILSSDELRDLASNRASTNSGSSSCMNINSDEYFNVDELLRDITRDGTAPAEERQENVDRRFCVKTPVNSEQFFLPEPEPVVSCIGNFEVAHRNAQPRNQAVPDEGPSVSACSGTGQVKRNLSDRSSNGVNSSSSSSSSDSSKSGNDGGSSDSSSSSKTPQSKRRKSINRLAKIGKKLLCFS